MCGTPKGIKAEDSKDDDESSSLQYAKRRAKILQEGKQAWIKRMDTDGKIRWKRSYALNSNTSDDPEITRKELSSNMSVRVLKAQLLMLKIDVSKAVDKSELVDALFDFYESTSSMKVTTLKESLQNVGVDDSKCIEKSDLVKLMRLSIRLNVRGKFDGYIRSFDERGELSWVPANLWSMEAIVRAANGKVIASVDELRNASMLPFARKIGWFRHKIGLLRIPWNRGHHKIRVRRDRLLGDAYDNFRMLSPADRDFWKIFRFEFIDEPALDAGGVAREWFSEVGRALFNVDFGLFSYGDADNLCYQINPHSGLANETHLEYFRFVGRLLGKALFDQQLIAAHLTLPMYKHILGWPIVMRDLEFVSQVMSKSLNEILIVEDAEDLMLDFTTIDECFGKIEVVPLKRGGEDIDVTNHNRHEYAQLLLRHHMFDRVKGQLSQLLQGFYEVIPPALVSIFDFQELELMVNGLPQIDAADWEQNTLYKGDFHPNHKIVKWFWEIVGEMDQEMRARLLQFSTGTSRVPVQGFKALQSRDGKLNPFTLKSVPLKSSTKNVSASAFPIAHTCFNRIDLPVYENRAEMKRLLDIAIQMEATGFGIE
eukprot:g1633.t1